MIKLCVLLLLTSLALTLTQSRASTTHPRKKVDPNDNKGQTPFFLQDPADSLCLGPNGFTVCDERALWILTRRKGKKTYSLVSLVNGAASQNICFGRKSSWFGFFKTDKIGLGDCSKHSAKSWDFEFVDQMHVKLSTQGMCLVRGKKTYKSSVSVQSCSKGAFVSLKYEATAVHENGFYLKAADGACFDGSKFRSCTGLQARSLLWGIGIKYKWGKANRYFFNFNPHERNMCIVAKGYKVEKGICKQNGALRWSLIDGQLAYNNGKLCVARLPDNTAVLSKCSEASEYVSLDVPEPAANTNKQN